MEITELDNYYFRQKEPFQGCLLALKSIITEINEDIIHTRKFQIPFFYYKDWKLAFLWVYRKKIMIGTVIDKRANQIISEITQKDIVETMLINPDEDIPVSEIIMRIKENIKFYDSLILTALNNKK